MKKEYVAIYAGFALFVAAFIASAVLDSTGHKHQSHITVDASVLLLGVTMLVGVYSNMKNYGYFWTGVRRSDLSLSFAEMDENYPRIEKGTVRYRLGMAFISLFAVGVCIFGVMVLLKELKKPNQAPDPTPPSGVGHL
jgi:hypothetical protein